MKKLGFILFLVVTLAACTITKRQHLGGWHVEWKHRHQTDQSEVNQDQLVTEKQQNESIKTLDYTAVDSSNTAFEERRPESEVQELPVTTAYSNTVVKKSANPSHHVKSLSGFLSPKESVKKLKDGIRLLRTASETQDMFTVSVLLIIIGVLLLGLALLFLFLEVLSASLGTPFLVYSGVTFAGGLIMIVVGIVLGAKTAADSKKHKDKEKPERVKKEKTQEEKDEAMWAQYKRAVRASIILAVLFFALSLFFIAIDSVIPLVPIMAILFVIFILLVWGRYKQKIKEAEGTVEPKKA